MWLPLSGQGSGKEQWLLSALLSGRKLPPSSRPGAKQFSSSPNVSGAFYSAATILELRVSESKSVCGSFNRICHGLQKFLSFTASILTGFCRQKLWLLVLALEPWAGRPGVGLGPLASEISLLIFSCHTWVWDQPVPHLHPS